MTELVERARDGDVDAFVALVEQRQARMARLASAILGDADDADAALDDWLVAIWRALPSLRDVGRFEAWSDRILVNGCRRRIRERSRQRSRLAPLPLAEDPSWTSGCDPGAAIADRDALARAFDEIAVEDRAALVLHHLEGYALAEIAERLEMPVGTLKSRLSRARAVLRRSLAGVDR